MSFSAVFAKSASRFVRKLDPTTKQRLERSITKLCDNPFPTDTVRVQGEKEKVFRVRAGSFRILYVVLHESKELIILKIDKRSRVYD